jgi:predicted RecB family endonuclease
VLDWWQAVIDETKELVDDDLGRIRRQEEAQWAEDVAALREMLAELTAKVDRMASSGGGPSPKPAR